MRVGVVGGRDFSDYSKLSSVLDELQIDMVVSGGANGADDLAYRYARDRGIVFVMQPPLGNEIKDMGFARAAKRRNLRIVSMSDYLVAFPTAKSKGTWHAVQLAKKLKVPGKIIKVGSIGTADPPSVIPFL